MPMVPTYEHRNSPLRREARAQRRAVGGGIEHAAIDAVRDHRDALGRNAARLELLLVAAPDRDDARRGRVHPPLEPAEAAQQPGAAHRAHRRDRLGPQVAHLEHEGHPAQPAHEDPRPAAEELRRGGDHQIRAPRAEPRERGRRAEGQVVEDPAHGPLVGRQVGPDAQRLDALDRSRASASGCGSPGRRRRSARSARRSRRSPRSRASRSGGSSRRRASPARCPRDGSSASGRGCASSRPADGRPRRGYRASPRNLLAGDVGPRGRDRTRSPPPYWRCRSRTRGARPTPRSAAPCARCRTPNSGQ